MSALLDWLATQPEQQLDAAGDPRAGMTGASYAGGIELVVGGHRPPHRRHRARRSPGTRCSPRSIATTSSRAAGPRRSRGSASPRRPRSASSAPPGVQTGTVDPHITSALTEGPRHRPPVRRGPRLVREPRPRRRARLADPRADAARAGHRRHPLHAQRGDPQLRAAEGQRRARAHAVVLRRPRRVPDAGRQQPRRDARRGLAAALADGRPRRRRRPDLRVAGRRRPVAQRARLAAGAGPGHDRPGLGHADLQPGRHRVLGARRGRHAVAQRRERRRSRRRRSTSTRSASRSSSSTTRAPRPTRAGTSSPRSSTSSATSCSATRSRRSRSSSTACRTRSRARWRASPRRSTPARTTRCRSPAARASTGRCARRAASR